MKMVPCMVLEKPKSTFYFLSKAYPLLEFFEMVFVRCKKYVVEKSFGHSEWDGQLNLKFKEEFIFRCLKNEQDGARIIEIDVGLPKIIKLT